MRTSHYGGGNGQDGYRGKDGTLGGKREMSEWPQGG